MTQQVQEMYQKGIIDKYERDTYMLYEGNDSGREYLKNMLQAIVLEEPQKMPFKGSFAWCDGRISVWREIALTISKINMKLEEYLHDERSSYGDDPNRYPTGIDPRF